MTEQHTAPVTVADMRSDSELALVVLSREVVDGDRAHG